MSGEIALELIRSAQRTISATVMPTPLVYSHALSNLTGADVFFKLETVQPTGSFKVRGATNKVSKLTDAERDCGLITISSGNHGRALAWAARRLGVEATVCLYSSVPSHKIEAIRQLGANVVICGDSYEEAELGAHKLMKESGLYWCDPFDDPDVICGQGVIGLEIVDELPRVDTVIVPLSGGGLFSGIATAVKSLRPGAELIGVANRHGNGMLASLDAGRPVPIEEKPSLADCMAGTISSANRHTFRITRNLIDRAMMIEEKEIAPAVKHCCIEEGFVAEGGAALPVALLLQSQLGDIRGRQVVLVISGRNIDAPALADIIRNGQNPP